MKTRVKQDSHTKEIILVEKIGPFTFMFLALFFCYASIMIIASLQMSTGGKIFSLFILILTICLIARMRIKKYIKNGTYKFILQKKQEFIKLSHNHLNHQNYFQDTNIKNYLKKIIWKEIYSPSLIIQSFGILFILVMIIMSIAYTVIGIDRITNINNIIGAILTGTIILLIILSFIWIFLLRKMYKNKLKDPFNRYFFYNIRKKSYKVTRQQNTQGAYDYILKKI